ncbi:hypothetical protein CRE_17228 [Caenorhabditis remanei]|uniref:Uncharacterized protein n=1 Tax=Caenorhabditis remanei TaxID=31234 RepID=E3MA72_CAERE|nr:hypothetical protein CRE_17228 [Caenorhabditis remanei]
MNKTFVFLLFVIVASVLAQDRPSRLHRERVRSQSSGSTTEAPEEHHEEHHEEVEVNKSTDKVMGSMDTLSALARVQRDQAETFRLWASQFEVFKNNVMKFMEQTTDVLQKQDKKIKTLQRVVRKIASDIDE